MSLITEGPPPKTTDGVREVKITGTMKDSNNSERDDLQDLHGPGWTASWRGGKSRFEGGERQRQG